MSLTDKLEELKIKFWAAETSLEEEKQLANYFSASDDDSVESLYFQYLDTQRQVTYQPRKKRKVISIFRKNIISIAAGLAILACSVILLRPPTKPEVIVANTPEEALYITKNALALLNSKVQRGNTMVLSNMNQFEKINVFK